MLFYDLIDVASMTEMPKHDILAEMADGALPRPIIVSGKEVWTKRDIEVIPWLLQNKHRFKKGPAVAQDLCPVLVYFIQGSVTNNIKIGSSREPKRRLNEIQKLNGTELTLLGVIPGGAERERELHKLFAAYRLEGEWFSTDILDGVKSIIELETNADLIDRHS